MQTEGLSLTQAPPIQVPFRLFLGAPPFLLAAALIMGWQGSAVLASRWSPAALAVTHLITVGFLGQVMAGALLQMLPVLAGAPVPAVRLAGALLQVLLTSGAALLAWGFLGGGAAVLTAGALLASLGFLTLVLFAGAALGRARGAPRSVWAMRLALLALVVTFSLGLLLTAALRGWVALPALTAWVDLHLAWGLLGWVGLLIAGVAYQVVPMFHVTPPYPAWLSRWLAPVVVAALAAASLSTLAGLRGPAAALSWLAAAAFGPFACLTLWLQHRRQRRRIDAALLYWWSAMVSLLAALACAALGRPVTAGVLLLVGVGIGLPSGMLMKIVPFLAWFHLQSRQIARNRFDVRIPHMRTFMPEEPARWLFAGHLLTLLGFVAASVAPRWAGVPVAALGTALGLTAAGLMALLATGVWRFARIAFALESKGSAGPPQVVSRA